MGTCEFRDDVAVQLLGGLTAEESLRVDQHVRGCDECAQQRRELSIVRSLLDTLPAEPMPVAPAELGDLVVERLVSADHDRRRRDLRMGLLGAAAAAVIAVVVVVAVGFFRSDASTQELSLVTPAAAPNAWGQVNLHPRVDGTIVDLEAGDLPVDGARYEARVVDPNGAVLASQEFVVDTDGWAQVLLATSRPMQPGDTVEVAALAGDQPITVLSCRCEV